MFLVVLSLFNWVWLSILGIESVVLLWWGFVLNLWLLSYFLLSWILFFCDSCICCVISCIVVFCVCLGIYLVIRSVCWW